MAVASSVNANVQHPTSIAFHFQIEMIDYVMDPAEMISSLPFFWDEMLIMQQSTHQLQPFPAVSTRIDKGLKQVKYRLINVDTMSAAPNADFTKRKLWGWVRRM